jgi:hypothetical protein
MLQHRVRQGPHVGSTFESDDLPVVDRLPFARLPQPLRSNSQTL